MLKRMVLTFKCFDGRDSKVLYGHSNERSSDSNAFFCNFLLSYYRKIPIIRPGLIFVQKAFFLGLFSEGLIFGGAYFWRSLFSEGLITGGNFAFQNGLGLTIKQLKTLRQKPKTP